MQSIIEYNSTCCLLVVQRQSSVAFLYKNVLSEKIFVVTDEHQNAKFSKLFPRIAHHRTSRHLCPKEKETERIRKRERGACIRHITVGWSAAASRRSCVPSNARHQ